MIVVMPGRAHPHACRGGGVVSADANAAFDGRLPRQTSLPYVEQRYRVAEGVARRHAIAGLSMGGGQTLDIATAHARRSSATWACSARAFFGVFRSAGTRRAAAPQPWTRRNRANGRKRNAAALADDRTKKGLKLFWFSDRQRRLPAADHEAGKVEPVRKEYGYSPVYKETAGGHTWINWRDYLSGVHPHPLPIEESHTWGPAQAHSRPPASLKAAPTTERSGSRRSRRHSRGAPPKRLLTRTSLPSECHAPPRAVADAFGAQRFDDLLARCRRTGCSSGRAPTRRRCRACRGGRRRYGSFCPTGWWR